MKALKLWFFLSSFILSVGLACSSIGLPAGGNNQNTQAPPNTQTENTQTSSQPTSPPESTVAATEEPASQSEQFFTDEFDSEGNWNYFFINGSNSTIAKEDNPKMSVATADSLLTFDLNAEGLWVYDVYQPFEYDNVRLDTRVINRGVNNNNVSLICRYTDGGWYEFNIANNGLYTILAASVNADGKALYNLIFNGGSTAIKSGKETNEYTAICNGRELSLFINGKEARTVTDNKFVYKSGKVGVSVSSFNVLPVTVDVDWVKISQP